jgi:ABC-2 type transport system ATP-binding protein
MKKKLAFMGVLCLNRPVYMLDEPYNGIDLETSQHFKLIMKALKESDKTLILTSHIFESLTSICDTISYLQAGKIQFTLQRPEFPTMEERIFGEMNIENEQAIRKLMQPSPTDK